MEVKVGVGGEEFTTHNITLIQSRNKKEVCRKISHFLLYRICEQHFMVCSINDNLYNILLTNFFNHLIKIYEHQFPIFIILDKSIDFINQVLEGLFTKKLIWHLLIPFVQPFYMIEHPYCFQSFFLVLPYFFHNDIYVIHLFFENPCP